MEYYPNDDLEFEAWAFGNDCHDSLSRMNAWNERHGHLLMLHQDDGIYESLQKMYRIYLEKS